MGTTDSILRRLDQCPPFLCYIAAHRGKAIRPSLSDLYKAAGMSQRTFSRIVCKTSWAGVTVKRAQQVSQACGVNLLEPDGVLEWAAGQMALPDPFPELKQRRNPRKAMLKKLNLLAAKAVMAE